MGPWLRGDEALRGCLSISQDKRGDENRNDIFHANKYRTTKSSL
jgi:hypothetical protein